jgi:membrane-associated PAP2 superfamily phosphatase
MVERVVWPKTWMGHQTRWLLLTAGVLLVVFEGTGLDTWISNFFYDAAQKSFPWKEQAWFESIFHVGLKWLMLGAGVLTACVVGWRGVLTKQVSIRQWGMGVAAMVMIPLVIVLLKWMTHRSCPWSLDVYGGAVPHMGMLAQLFDPHSRDAGQCFPAGHSAGGFMWLGWGLAVWHTHVRWRKVFLWVGVLAGTFMGLTRVMQGAHFVSHVLWAAWFAWVTALSLAGLFRLAPVVSRAPS